MNEIDYKWLLLFVAQLGAGLAIVFAGGSELRELGIGLIGGAFGAGVTAGRTLIK
ncbi:MAG: hypothetical protein RL487_1061 [Actinomycetota bacterium]|jgi:hypothetical protein